MIRQAANAKERDMIIFVGIISIAVAIFLYGRKRRRERLMYLS
jgi:LPXTG-motif cell wall-anchored protein